MTDSRTKYVLLTGSDLGDKTQNLNDAKLHISKNIGEIEAVSEILESEPWGFDSSTTFLNQALLITTHLAPQEILREIKLIEEARGRTTKRGPEYTSRIIDIDILCGENVIHHTEELSVPHKFLHQRIFALTPLCELVPNWLHPLLEESYRVILERLLTEKPTQSSS